MCFNFHHRSLLCKAIACYLQIPHESESRQAWRIFGDLRTNSRVEKRYAQKININFGEALTLQLDNFFFRLA